MSPDVWCYTIKYCQEHTSNLNAQRSDRLTSSGYAADGEPELRSCVVPAQGCLGSLNVCVCGGGVSKVQKFNRLEGVHRLDHPVPLTQYVAMMMRS